MNSGEYFESLDPVEQERIFTKAGAQAIRDGADINQVVNARRGMSQIQTPGSTKWLVTNEGATRRGIGRRSMNAAGIGDVKKVPGSRYRRTISQRLMPETIYQVGRDQEHIMQLLKTYGYI